MGARLARPSRRGLGSPGPRFRAGTGDQRGRARDPVADPAPPGRPAVRRELRQRDRRRAHGEQRAPGADR